MSELINNSEKRKSRLKELILKLHHGASEQSVRGELLESLSSHWGIACIDIRLLMSRNCIYGLRINVNTRSPTPTGAIPGIRITLQYGLIICGDSFYHIHQLPSHFLKLKSRFICAANFISSSFSFVICFSAGTLASNVRLKSGAPESGALATCVFKDLILTLRWCNR